MLGEIFQAADRAEHDIEDIDDVLYHLGEIRDRLKDSKTRTADFLCAISDMIDAAKAEKGELEATIATAEAYERRALEREYWEAKL